MKYRKTQLKVKIFFSWIMKKILALFKSNRREDELQSVGKEELATEVLKLFFFFLTGKF